GGDRRRPRPHRVGVPRQPPLQRRQGPGVRRVLILGGTAEARALAASLTGAHVVSSLAGRVTDPRLPAGEVRLGGFGGAEGLAAWLRENRIDRLVDATHPFAERMSAHAAHAARATG